MTTRQMGPLKMPPVMEAGGNKHIKDTFAKYKLQILKQFDTSKKDNEKRITLEFSKDTKVDKEEGELAEMN